MTSTLLVTGHRKSGTTLLHRLLDGHRECVVYPTDLGLLYAYLPCFAAELDDPVVQRQRLAHVLRKSLGKFEGMTLGPMAGSRLCVETFARNLQEDLTDEDLKDAGKLFSAVVQAFRAAARVHPKAILVVKETSQSIHFGRLQAEDPSVRLMGIVRDPRDNYAAISAGVDAHYSRLGEDALKSLASVINRARMDLLSLHELSVSDSAHVIRFEDLTSNPEPTMRAAANWIGIEFESSMLQPTQGDRVFSGNNHQGKKFDGISSRHVGAWTERISRFEAGVIEYWLADAMAHWDYAPQLTKLEARTHFSQFYDWYNCQYFFHGTSFDVEAEEAPSGVVPG